MAYSIDHIRTAGKVTIFTTIVGVFAFAIIFLFNLGPADEGHVSAQENATTSVTVLNTPPAWTASTTEEFESSTSSPTDEGQEVSWVAIGTDSNSEDYYLLICSTNATPTANSGAAPTCGAGAIQWAVSATTTSGTQARAATTTTASTTPFAGEEFDWYGWVCDGNAGTPRCSVTATQGENATNSSPFYVNHRPNFTAFSDNSPGDPGDTITFFATSSDPDSIGGVDTVQLHVCATAGFSTTTDSCTGTTLATSTFTASNPTATFSISIPTPDTTYGAFGYIVDEHGLESLGAASGTDAVLTVNNVAPVASSTSISLVQASGTDMYLTVESGETTGFTLQFTAVDNNSCDAVGGGLGDEIVGYDLSIYRSGVGSTTCTSAVGVYNANNCYPSGLATTTWNLSCTASSTSCVDDQDSTEIWDCTFPLWYIADPTDGTATSTVYFAENWLAQVRPVDDDGASSSFQEASSGVDVRSFLAFALTTATIPYGSLEPGQDSGTLAATTTVEATGNVGLDKDVTGTSMCTTYSGSTPCPTLATSTIPDSEQEFATSTVAYGSGTALSSTSPQEIEINVPKSISTSTATSANAYWGIAVPAAITFAGSYTGENTFTALVGEPSEW